MQEITIRAGTPADFPAMNALWRQAVLARRGVEEQSAAEAIDASRTLEDGGSFAIAAVSGATLVGMAVGLPARDDDGLGAPIPGLCHISMVAVAPGWWSRGIGGRILDSLLDAIRDRGFTQAQLWTQQSNSRAIQLYRRFGFLATGREKQDDAGELILQFRRSL